MSIDWEAFLTQYPNAHFLQTAAWGELKSAFGWKVIHLTTSETGAQIMLRQLPLGMAFAYLAKGPIGKNWNSLWPLADEVCRKNHAIFLKVEPDQWIEAGGIDNPPLGFYPSSHTIQPPRTLLVDLKGDEVTILGRMKQKTRYNIKLSQKKGVSVHPTADLQLFYKLMQTTGARDEFGVHSLPYYQRAYDLFHVRGACELFLAEYEGQPLAALMVFTHGERAWYLYGGSSNEHRDRMPTYLLQWEAMRWAREHHCTVYDLWGVPDEDENKLEAQFSQRSDGLWGVYRNKRGFGGKVVRSSGPWDRIYSPLAYRFFMWWISRRSIIDI